MDQFSCTESNTGPILDIASGALMVAFAVAVAVEGHTQLLGFSSGEEVSKAEGVWGVASLTALYGGSVAVGFGKTSRCREALRLLAERNSAAVAPGR